MPFLLQKRAAKSGITVALGNNRKVIEQLPQRLSAQNEKAVRNEKIIPLSHVGPGFPGSLGVQQDTHPVLPNEPIVRNADPRICVANDRG
jgi:hypothetical protein